MQVAGDVSCGMEGFVFSFVLLLCPQRLSYGLAPSSARGPSLPLTNRKTSSTFCASEAFFFYGATCTLLYPRNLFQFRIAFLFLLL